MAEYGNLETFTREAGGNLSAKQYHIVRASAAGKCDLGSVQTDTALMGVLQNDPQSGEFAAVADFGTSKIVAGGAVTNNALISCNSAGRALDAASGNMVIGRALEAATTDGEIVKARIFSPIRWMGAV